MNICIVDGYTTNPGDVSWAPLEALGNVTIYEFTKPEDIAERAKDAEILITNKTVLSVSYTHLDVYKRQEELITEHETSIYHIAFSTLTHQYDYQMNGVTGEIIKKSSEPLSNNNQPTENHTVDVQIKDCLLYTSCPEFIIPNPLNKEVAPAVAKAVKDAARKTGVARV